MSDSNLRESGATPAVRLDGINWSAVLPHTSIFRSFKMAMHPTKLALGTLAAIGIWLLGWVLDTFFGWFGVHHPDGPGQPLFRTSLEHIATTLAAIVDSAISLRLLHGGVLEHVFDLLRQIKTLFTQNIVFGVLLYVGSLIIAGLTIGAIARIAALQSARDEKISLGEALSFARRKFVSFLAAPAIPVIIVVGILAVLMLGAVIFGVVLNWVRLGYIATGLLSGLALVAGLLASLTIVATVAGVPLMYPTIAVEGSDAFDAVSRSYSYVFGRPWQAALAAIIALVYGGLCFLFLKLVLFVALLFTQHCVASVFTPMGDVWVKPLWVELWRTPAVAPTHTAAIGYFFVWLWVNILLAVLAGWVISFYISASTQVYYLLRKAVDATEVDDVYVEDYEDEELSPAPAAATPSALASGVQVNLPPKADDDGDGAPPTEPKPDAPSA